MWLMMIVAIMRLNGARVTMVMPIVIVVVLNGRTIETLKDTISNMSIADLEEHEHTRMRNMLLAFATRLH